MKRTGLASASIVLIFVSCQYQGEPIPPEEIASSQSRLVVDACGSAGADIGAKINAADATLGASPGDITMYTCSGNIATQVVLNPGHTLKLAAGTYTHSLDKCAVLLKHDSSVVGSGWQTVFQESSNSPSNEGICVFRGYNDSVDGLTNDDRITIRDLQIIAGTGVVSEGTRSAINLGNAHDALVDNVFINSTHAIGVQIGGSGATGIFANGVTVRNSLFKSVYAVATALVNGRDVNIEGNRFVGVQPGSSTAYVDLEINAPYDRIENFRVMNNTFDSSASTPSANRWPIVMYGANTNPGPGIISNNVIMGGTGNHVCTPTNAIFVGAENVMITSNSIKYFCHAGILLPSSAQHNIVSNNVLKYTGDPAVITVEGQYNYVTNNIVDGFQTSPDTEGYFAQIAETSTANNNIFAGNIINSYMNTFGGAAWFHARVALVGAASVAHNNVIDRVETSDRGGKVETPTMISSNHVIEFRDHIILGDASAGNLTITLSNAANTSEYLAPNWTGGKGRTFVIKATNSAGGNVTVVPVSSQTIDGAASLTLTPLQGATIISDGSNWHVIGRT